MRSVLLYTLARLAIFAVTAALLALFGARGLLLLGLAVIISGIVSFVLLTGQRDAMSQSLLNGIRSRRERFEQAKTKEDG